MQGDNLLFMKTTTEIKLLGQRIALKSAGDPEIVGEVIEMVSGLLGDSEKRSKTGAPHHVALLALLALAEEYVQAKRRAAGHKTALDEKSRKLMSMIEAEFKGETGAK